MKTIIKRFTLFAVIMLLAGYASFAQKTERTQNSKATNSKVMKTYLIERDIPDAGKLTPY
jgi:CHASE3 domain sensor protein